MTDDNHPTHERIFQIIDGLRATAALKAALDLGLFTALAGESKTAESLAETIDASHRGVRILCDSLVIGGLLQKRNGSYQSSPDAALFLDEGSPAYFGSACHFMLGKDMFDSFSNLAGAVRDGGTLLDDQGMVDPDNPLWVQFARDMAPLVTPATGFIAELALKGTAQDKPLRVLDVAASHGLFGIEIAKQHARAQVVALDWAAVLEVACENAKTAGVSDRLTLLPGNAFEVDLGEGHDVVLLPNFLHHYDIATCTKLLRKVHGSLRDGGRAVIVEFVPDENRVTPPDQAAFALTMLATTVAGDAYTYKQLDRMATDAGFARSELHRMMGPPQAVVVATK